MLLIALDLEFTQKMLLFKKYYLMKLNNYRIHAKSGWLIPIPAQMQNLSMEEFENEMNK